jgi:acetyl esterase
MPDRDTDLDPQAAAFLEGVDASITPPASTLSVENARRLLDELFAVDDPEPVAGVRNFEFSGPDGPVPVRIYSPDGDPPHPALVFFHGGGWLRGSIDGYDGLCRLLCARAGCTVISVGYRLSPEHPFPAGFEDCYAATEWVVDNAGDLLVDPARVAIGGDSGGGTLAAAVALAARDRDGPDVAHQLLLYPAVNAPADNWFDSYDENGEGYLLEMSGIEYYYDQYLDSPAHVGNDYAFPLRARDLSGLPNATVLTAGFDPLRDEGEAYVRRLRAADVATQHLHYEGQIHAFLSLFEHIEEGRDAIDELAAHLAEALDTAT